MELASYRLITTSHLDGCQQDNRIIFRYTIRRLHVCRVFGQMGLLFLSASLVMLFMGSLAQASSTTSDIPAALPLHSPIQKEILIVGSEQDYPPFATGMTDAEAGGFTVELWKAVAVEAGLSYIIRVKPFREVLQDFKEGRTDVVINLARSEERQQFADFTVPHVVVHGAIFVRKGESSIRTEDDLANKSIIVLHADLAHDYAVAKGWGPQLVLVDTTAEGFRLLASGKHDAILIGKLPGMQTVLALGLTDIEALKIRAGFAQKFGFAVHEGQSDLLEKINEGLAITKANGTYDVLYEDWFGLYEVKEVTLLDSFKYILPLMLVFIGIGGYFFYRRQDERREFTTKLQFITDHAPVLLAQCDKGKYYKFANKSYAGTFGLEPADLIGKHAREILGEESFAIALPYMEMALSGQSTIYDLKLPETSNGVSVGSVHYSPEYDKSGHVVGFIIAAISDIIERKKAEEMLRKLSQAIEQAGEAILITDLNGIIEYVNPAFSELTGYSRDEAIGKNSRMLHSGKQPASFYEKMWKTILSGNVWHGKVTDKKKDGTSYPVMETISPIKNELGEVTHFVGHQQDLSDNEELENKFYQAQKMEALGTLVGGIAHEFNNTLAGVTGNLYLAKRGASELPNVIEKLNTIEKLSFKSADLIKNLLSFARKGFVRKRSIEFSSFLKEIIKIHQISMPENIKLDLDLETDPESMIVNWDANLLQQVVMNLINNARDALKGIDKPLITIKLRKFFADAEFLTSHPESEADKFACLSIKDNGVGINAADLPHIFEPFYTTKEVGKGTGLGLSMVTGAIQTHQGYIDVESKGGEGSLFEVYLPLIEREEVTALSKQEELAEYEINETILLVDDESHILDVGKELLEALGYQVLVASDGLEAVEIFKANRDEVSIVITDIMMPKLGGVESVELIKQIRSDIKVIFTTGYNKEEELLGDIYTSEAIILYKPYDIDELRRTISSELAS